MDDSEAWAAGCHRHSCPQGSGDLSLAGAVCLTACRGGATLWEQSLWEDGAPREGDGLLTVCSHPSGLDKFLLSYPQHFPLASDPRTSI